MTVYFRKLVSSLELPIRFNERFKVTSVPFFIPDFNSLSYELDHFTYKVLKTFSHVPCEKSKIAFLFL